MFLPTQIGRLYEESLVNPDLLEMASHIALLEARMHEILGDSTVDHVVPRWRDMASAVAALTAAVNDSKAGGEVDIEAILEASKHLNETVVSGVVWDSTWEQVTTLMDQIRKLTDTEVRRKRELNQMIPVERVIVLMTAVGDAIKRCVTNPDEVVKVQREINRLVMSDHTVDNQPRLDVDYKVLPPGDIGVSGGRSMGATRRRHIREATQREMANANQKGDSESDSGQG